MGKKSCFFVACFTFVVCSVFAAFEEVVEKIPSLPLPNASWTEIGKIRHKSSSEIADSKLSIGFEGIDRDIFEPSKVYDKIAATGFKWARCQTGWNKSEKQKGVYDFKWLDDVVDNLLKRGIKPWFNVGYGNGLYMENMTNPTGLGHVPLYFGDECLQAWKNYIDALSKHFKGRVTHFEIWNEPNVSGFWRPKQPDPRDYLRLVKLTADIIRKNIPDAKIGASSAHRNVGFTTEFFNIGAGKFIDFYSIHTYCIVPEDSYDTDIRALWRVLQHGLPEGKVSLWQGESGFAAFYPKGHYMRPATTGGEYMQAKWMLRRFVLDLSKGMGMSSLFQCVDLKDGYKTSKGPVIFGKYGLFKNITYQPRVASEVIKNFTPIFDCDTHDFALSANTDTRRSIPEGVGVSRLADSAKRMETFVRKGYPLFAFWIPEDIQFQMNPVENAGFYFINYPRMNNPVLIDPMSGHVYKYADKIGSVDYNNRSLKGVPLADYPLIITDYEAVKDVISLK